MTAVSLPSNRLGRILNQIALTLMSACALGNGYAIWTDCLELSFKPTEDVLIIFSELKWITPYLK